ncbi:MAG: thermonuclease family protein [Hyphomicrobium sp.]|nr:thermonuclease family protein [Hyphomicrobium sp.]
MRPSLTLALVVGAALAAAAATYTPGIVVVDGDTVDHAWWRWRIEGWDTPEIRQARCPEERALGIRARDRLRSLTAGPGVAISGRWHLDRYGRRIGRLRLPDGRDAGAVLAAEGLARPYDGAARSGWCP